MEGFRVTAFSSLYIQLCLQFVELGMFFSQVQMVDMLLDLLLKFHVLPGMKACLGDSQQKAYSNWPRKKTLHVLLGVWETQFSKNKNKIKQ